MTTGPANPPPGSPNPRHRTHHREGVAEQEQQLQEGLCPHVARKLYHPAKPAGHRHAVGSRPQAQEAQGQCIQAPRLESCLFPGKLARAGPRRAGAHATQGRPLRPAAPLPLCGPRPLPL